MKFLVEIEMDGYETEDEHRKACFEYIDDMNVSAVFIKASEVLPNAKVLTRAQIMKAIMKADSKWLADPATTIDRALDELFGVGVDE